MNDNDFTLEKLKIAEKLDALAISVAAFKESHDIMKTLIAKHDNSLYGDGNGKLGITIKLDRLEQDFETRKWHFRAVWAALVGMVVKLVWGSFRE